MPPGQPPLEADASYPNFAAGAGAVGVSHSAWKTAAFSGSEESRPPRAASSSSAGMRARGAEEARQRRGAAVKIQAAVRANRSKGEAAMRQRAAATLQGGLRTQLGVRRRRTRSALRSLAATWALLRVQRAGVYAGLAAKVAEFAVSYAVTGACSTHVARALTRETT